MVPHRKLFLGSRLKRLRRDRELNQTAMAATLGISASYLNHLERNQRPVTVGILLRLAEAFDIDIKAFAAEGGESGGADQLSEIFSDGLLSDLGVSRAELVELGDNSPAVADGVTRLYTALRELQRQPARMDEEDGGADPRVLITPETWVRDYIQAQRNHFPELEERAETLGGALGDPLSVAEPLRRRLKDAYGVEARVVAPRNARRREPAFRSAEPQPDAVVAAAAGEPHLRPRLPAGLAGVRAADRAPGRYRAGRPTSAAAACCT